MPQGDKSAYSAKQKRQASHIEESEKKRGRSAKASARIAWATVNKQDGGAKGKGAAKKSASKRTSSASKKKSSSRSSSRSASAARRSGR